MKPTLVSKNNIGGATALLLVILLSQSKFFNFLLDTALGRAILILFILVISYTNKILGVVSVLFIIIMFNSSDIGYLEGFDTPTTSSTSSTSATDSTTVADSSTKPNKTSPTNSSTTTSSSTAQKNPPTTAAPAATPTTITTATEGFNTIDNERNIQKGKQSNSIPVNNATREPYANVEPFDGGTQFGIF